MTLTVPSPSSSPVQSANGNTVNPSALQALIQLRQAGLIRDTATVDDENQQQCSAWEGSGVEFDANGHVVFLDLGACRLRKGFPPGIMDLWHESPITKTLKRLNLGGTDLPVSEMMELLELLAHNLESLHLGGNYLCDAGAERVGAWIPTARQLHTLDLRYNEIGPVGCRALVQGFQQHTKITKLYLEGNRIDNEGAAALATWLEAVNQDEEKVPDNNNNKNTDDDTRTIPHSTCPLLELYLGANQIGAQGAAALAESLRVNKTITKIYLEGNQIGEAGAQAFTNVLLECQGNTALKHLFCDNNNIGKDASKRLAQALNSATAIGDAF